MNQPQLSVIIPSYNHGAFLGRAISSVLATDGVVLEVVVVDDGSTDSSRTLLESYHADPRVQIHLQDNQGAHSALNRGLELSRGKLVFILNSDDAFDPHRIPVLADRLNEHPEAALAASWIEVVDAEDARLGIKQAWHSLPPWAPPSSGPFLSALGDPRLSLLETNWISTTSNIAFPTALISKHGLGFSPLRYAHDWDFILSACHLGTLELVEEPLVQYRVHGANTIGEGVDRGQGLMRFEILWVVARHAMRLIRNVAGSEAEFFHLRDLLWTSAPTFGCDSVFDQLLLQRGVEEASPPAYDSLLDPDHPFSKNAIEALQD